MFDLIYVGVSWFLSLHLILHKVAKRLGKKCMRNFLLDGVGKEKIEVESCDLIAL